MAITEATTEETILIMEEGITTTMGEIIIIALL
jgi:hypothetical protein